MTRDIAARVIQNEMECVKRAAGGICDRQCGMCDLLLPEDTILEAYNWVLARITSEDL